MPVSISPRPLPSSSNSTLITVSLVLRSILLFRPIGVLLSEARFDGARVVVETFKPREMNDLRRQRAQRLFFRVNDRRPLEKIVGPQRRKEARAAAGGKHVIGPGEIIAQRRCRVGPEEHRPRVANLPRPTLRLLNDQFDVLR